MTPTPPDFNTPPFFNLNDSWINTAPEEITHYHDYGKGLPLLLLHGSGFAASAALNWWLNIPTLSQSFRTIAFDFIGYGETISSQEPPIKARFGIKQWGDHTLRLMDALAIEKAWLVGSSLGGWVALQLVIDYPERFYGVVSIGTGGAKRKSVQQSHLNLTSKPSELHQPTLSTDFIRQDLIKNISNEPLVSETVVNLRYRAALKEQSKGIRPYLLAARDRDRKEVALDFDALGKLTLPVLLTHGKEDKVVPLSWTWQLLEAIPTADAHIFSNCGHWPHIGRSDVFNKLLIDFISSQY